MQGIIVAFLSGAVLGLGTAAVLLFIRQALFDLAGIGRPIAPTEVFVEYGSYLLFVWIVSLVVAGILKSFAPKTNLASAYAFVACAAVALWATLRLEKFFQHKAVAR